jgi:citrate/tricarballylate utilization protein
MASDRMPASVLLPPLGQLARLGAGEAEVARVLNVCNACRYCEGYCAVFPAMERRLDFGRADIHYLANLCHHCGACLHACQYAPPHAFAVNVPQAMAVARATTYEAYAWPPAFGALYRHAGVATALALALGLAGFLVAMLAWRGTLVHPPITRAGSFYQVFPHGLLAGLFGAVFGWAVLSLGIGVARFWRGLPPTESPAGGGDWARALHDAATLRYLDGGGDGCHDEDDTPTHRRRRVHHLTAYGFALCFAATCVATVYHYGFGWVAPYGYLSLPVLLGSLGGLGLLAGPIGLWRLGAARDPLHDDPAQRPLDRGFLLLLMLTSVTGFAVLGLRATSLMGVALAGHLGVVMALFLTLPYGKAAHAPFRLAALLKWAVEKRTPNRLGVGGE